MRDLVVREAIVAMARDAAKCLHGLISAGEEVPYEVREPGDGSPLCRYEPLTERFVRDHAEELVRLDSFGAACAALEAAGLAGPYLERMGIGVPEQPRPRAELAGVAFLCRLWMDCTDFTLDDERLELAIEELQAGGEGVDGEIEVVVPVRGLQLPVTRLELATASLVRADTVDVPAEARSGDGLGVSPFEPAVLAVARVRDAGVDDDGIDPGLAAVDAFRRLVSTLRLFKPGGVGLGPHAWIRIAGDRWRRIATGAGRQRPGGYRLAEAELGELAAFSRALAAPGTPFTRHAAGRPGFATTLGRSLTRFEAGLERNVVVEALNDHLLALRFLLEGGGPAALGLPMRVAALCAEPERRDEVKAVVDRAIGLERELWSGEPASAAGPVSPAETAAGLEELARAILKDAAVGHLGSDLRVTADEILLADGLAVGDGAAEQRGTTTEWDLELVAETDDELDSVALGREPEQLPDAEEPLDAELAEPTGPGSDEPEPQTLADELDGIVGEVSELDRRISPEAAPEREEEMVIARAREIFGGRTGEPETAQLEIVRAAPPDPEHRPEPGPEPDRGANPVLRLIEQTRAERRAHHERVANLFPPPETTEWNVSEVAYDRTRRARVTEAS